MFRAVKRWCFRVILLVAVLLVVGFFFANALVQQYVDSHRSEVEAMAGGALKAQVAIGELDAEVRPFPQLHARRVTITWPESSRAPVFVDDLVVRLKFLPLLSGNLDLNYISIHVPAYQLSEEKPVKMVTDAMLHGRVMIEGPHIAIKGLLVTAHLNEIPVKLDAPYVHYDGTSVQFDHLSVTSGLSHVDLFGNFSPETMAFDLRLPDLLLTAETNRDLLKIFNTSPALGLGEVRGTLAAQAQSADEIAVRGDLLVKKFVRGKGLSADLFSLRKLDLGWSRSKGLTAKSDLATEALKIVDDKTIYTARKADGFIDYTREPSGASEIKGRLSLDQMSYADGRTTVKEVVATIDPIQVGIKASGDLDISVNIKGTAVKVENESVQVLRAGSVVAPLKISIPARGAYRVSGPITAQDAEVKTLKQSLNKVQGTVHMFLSSDQKSFVSKGLYFEALGKPSRLGADFRMNAQQFTMASVETDYFAGLVKGSAQLSRKGARPFTVQLQGEKLAMQRLRDAIMTESKGAAFGTIDSALVTMTGSLDNFPATIGGKGTALLSQPDPDKALISRLLFGALRSIPVINGLLDSGKSLGDRQVLEVSTTFKDGAVLFDSAKLSRESYTVTGVGKLGFDRQIDLKADVIFLQDTFSKLALGIGPLKRLFSRAGRIVVPIVVTGKVPDVSVTADMKTFIKNNSGIQFGEDILNGIGDIILPGSGTPAPDSVH